MIDYIDSGAASGKPFLASVNFLANHIPVQAPDSDIARYAAMYHDPWTALRAARPNRPAPPAPAPHTPPMATRKPPPAGPSLSADERKAAAGVMRAFAGRGPGLD